MATRTKSRSSNRSSSSRSSGTQSRGSESRSAFSWGGNAGPVFGAALAGVAIGLAANYGRKAIMQGMEATVGDWDEILAAEHDMALSIFDKMLATDASQTFKRKMLLHKLTHALDKHAHQEEMVVYPALREAGKREAADELNKEHGYVKQALYELENSPSTAPEWIEKVRSFRADLDAHVYEEETNLFPMLRAMLSEEKNKALTLAMNKEGFKVA